MVLQVIGAGFGRTGTRSLKEALEILGLGPCYHMEELLKDPQRIEYWEKIADGDEDQWDHVFAGYQSTVDFPGYRYTLRLLKQYPEAKIVFTDRDPSDWWESTYATIYQAEPGFLGKIAMIPKLLVSAKHRYRVRCFRLANQVWEKDFGGKFTTKAHAIKVYQDWKQQIIENSPADQLLIYQVKDGWRPLCSFLGVPIPEVSFPNLNRRANFKAYAATLLQ